MTQEDFMRRRYWQLLANKLRKMPPGEYVMVDGCIVPVPRPSATGAHIPEMATRPITKAMLAYYEEEMK